jgi:hypothetical protein
MDKMRRKLYENLARHEYLKGDVRSCRHYLLKSRLTLKNIALYVTSYSSGLRKVVMRKFKIFDIPYL